MLRVRVPRATHRVSLALLVAALALICITRPNIASIYAQSDGRSRQSVRYRAAVVEAVPASFLLWDGSAASARAMMMRNVLQVDYWAAKAAAQGSQIVVFPEDFVSSFGGGGLHWQSKYTTPALFAEPLPAPTTQLCESSKAAAAAPVARALACVAKRHGLVVVVGLGITGKCTSKQNPFDGRPLPCNTSHYGEYDGAAAFGPDGRLLGSAWKSHLAYTWAYNPDSWMEAPASVAAHPRYFDTPFGVRFGFLIDNDANFGDPTLPLLQLGVRDFVHPTWWLNAGFRGFGSSLPSSASASASASASTSSVSGLHGLSAVAFQAAFSSTHRSNLLAANGGYGAAVSGSGIWPADADAAHTMHYSGQSGGGGSGGGMGEVGRDEGYPGWLGVLDLVSPSDAIRVPPSASASSSSAATSPSASTTPSATLAASTAAGITPRHASPSATDTWAAGGGYLDVTTTHPPLPALGEAGTVRAIWLDNSSAIATFAIQHSGEGGRNGEDARITLRLSVGGINCTATVRAHDVAVGGRFRGVAGAGYALVAGSGLLPRGIYVRAHVFICMDAYICMSALVRTRPRACLHTHMPVHMADACPCAYHVHWCHMPRHDPPCDPRRYSITPSVTPRSIPSHAPRQPADQSIDRA